MLPVEQPFKTYTGLDGKPLENGYVYFGRPDENPVTAPVAVYWDADGTIPAPQPLRTLGGYIIRSGSPANVFLDAPYSILVQDAKGQQVFYARTSDEFSASQQLVAEVNQVVGDLAQQVSAAVQGLDAAIAVLPLTTSSQRLSRPAFIEQHITGFFGRGMLTAETNNVPTEQALAGGFAAGQATLVVTDAAEFVPGGCVTIKHDNGLYGTYFVDSKAANNIGIRPALRHNCITPAARIERTWFNRAHPGKFYIRELAQRVARSTELEAAMPAGRRVLFTNVSSNPNTIEDTLVALGNAAVSYFNADNVGETGTVASPVRFALGRTAYVENLLANSDGVETPFFDGIDITSAVVKVIFMAASANTQFSIQVFDELNIERGKYVIPKGASQRVLQTYTFPADLRGAKRVKVRIAVENFVAPGSYFTVDQIDVFEAPPAASKIIASPIAKIVCLGDSWIQGDLGSTAEREPLTTQLKLELPYATVINAGVGGNKIWQMLERFDADVAVHKPDYVVINDGTNECYSPSSEIFEPNSVNEYLVYYSKLLNRIAEIGARPIIIGVPAMAQSDPDVPAFAEWLLNDRAKAYARYFFEWQSAKPIISSGSGPNGRWTRYPDGTMEISHTVAITTTAANALASTQWTFPIPFAGIPDVTASPADYDSNQVLAAGSSAKTGANVSIRGVSSIGAATFNVTCKATGRWR